MNTATKKVSLHTRLAEYFYSVFSYLLICMCCVFLLFCFFFRLVSVDGASMYPNLYNNDKLIVSNFLYTPAYGDIIAIGRANAEESSIIKRVIALGGDTVNINFDSHLITVNDEVITENYPVEGKIEAAGDFSYPLTVPENCVFVLGDNRNNSVDSRYESVGFIKLDEITGKALIRLYPPGSFNIY